MLVYGDPRETAGLQDFVRDLLTIAPDTLDNSRRLLIRAGQLEQALEDAASPHPGLLRASRHYTDEAARMFTAHLQGERVNPIGSLPLQELTKTTPDFQLTVKVPEGFEFYTLYPEQYAAAAVAWRQKHPTLRRVLVIGIRSIGTTLSAIVRTVLLSLGIQAERQTVRPGGHPFQRKVALRLPSAFDHALVVDEGPGLSGSSMASVKQALNEAGLNEVTFLPGHANAPGHAASDSIRRCWADTPRIVTPLNDLRWFGRSLHQLLSDTAADFTNTPTQGPLQDLSVGRWRDILLQDQSSAPRPPAIPFQERTKYLWTGKNGTKILWKFEGLGTFTPADTVTTPTPFQAPQIIACNGFAGYEWVHGRRLRPTASVDTLLLRHLADYCRHTAQPPLTASQHSLAVNRLAQMLEVNLPKLCPDLPSNAWTILQSAALDTAPNPSYGDGRMAPWEWVRTPNGRILKTDWRGHTCDHTLIGRQSILWDIAGLIVEWNLDEEATALVIKHLSDGGPQISCPHPALHYYCIAYAAFRAALCSMASETSHCSRYTNRLNQLLTTQARNLYR